MRSVCARRLLHTGARADLIPAQIGDRLCDVETPSLVLDLHAFRRNLIRCNAMLTDLAPGVLLRPHAKSHKCADVAHLQHEIGGASGICCQKVGEAEAIVRNYSKLSSSKYSSSSSSPHLADVLLSNEILAVKKVERLVALAAANDGATKISVVVDSELGVDRVWAAARDSGAAGVDIALLVDVNMGQNRAGVDTIEEALHLARYISARDGTTSNSGSSSSTSSLPGSGSSSKGGTVSFGGVQCYHGWAQHMRASSEREECVADYTASMVRPLVAALDSDTDVRVGAHTAERYGGITGGTNGKGMAVTGGGTGSFLCEATSGVYNEVQPGSYAFMDRDYADNEWGGGGAEDAGSAAAWEGDAGFEHSLFVLTSVMSCSGGSGLQSKSASPMRAVTDSGLKSSSVDCGQPRLLCRAQDWDSLHNGEFFKQHAGMMSGLGSLTDSFVDTRLTDEHCQMSLSPGLDRLPIGLDDQLLLIPGHVDPTVNMHEVLVCIEEGRVSDLWGVARGVGH